MTPVDPTYDLAEAARYLRMSQAVLREKASRGAIKGAKPGKRWVFRESDLAAYLDSLYAASRQAPLTGSNPEIGACLSLDAAKCGGSISSLLTANEYESLLGLQTKDRR